VDNPPTGFFAYPSSPSSVPETIAAAVKGVNDTALARIKTWEQCRVGGNVIIAELCKEIGAADFFCADLTGINANVMFELGYAIARNKRTWLVLDTTISTCKSDFDRIRILTTVGYARYCNSHEINSRFLAERPFDDLRNTIFENSIKPGLTPTTRDTLLYLKSAHDIEASVRVSRRLDASALQVITDDPKESGVQTLAWYGKQLYTAQAVVCHLTSPDREGGRLHNARYALVAGMAYGMDKPLLMLAEGDFLAPVDYRDLLHTYHTAAQATRFLDGWLEPLEAAWQESRRSHKEYAQAVKLATELKGLQLGEYIAENEPEGFVIDYFVETAAFADARAGTHTIFVGRKGSGKTANLFKLADTLRRDRRNLVCVIKPVAYELEGVVELMRRFREKDLKGYALETLWKFLLYTEVGKAAIQAIGTRPDGLVRDQERALIKLYNEEKTRLGDDFSVRLERSVGDLESANLPAGEVSNVEGSRAAISESLHSGVLSKLRVALGSALGGVERVAILVDNLDKAWDRQAQIPELAEFLLALLGSASRVQTEFRKSDSRRESVNVSLAIFLRSDIFYKLTEVAREPDKLRYSKLTWNDPELLLRVVEERFASSHAGNVRPSELWSRYFCENVKETDTKQYLFGQILPRPRDLVFLVKAAVATAINRGHPRVEEVDLIDAQVQYSQYALESILVEGAAAVPSLETVLYEFAGSPSCLDEKALDRLFEEAHVEPESRDEVIDLLCALSFLGPEVANRDFRFANDPQEHKKNLVLARKLAKETGRGLTFMVNKPFWAFLETQVT
jgi:hypothetical protein